MTESSSKTELRTAMRHVVRSLTEEHRTRESLRLCARLAASSGVRSAHRMLVYLALPTEINLDPFIIDRLDAGVVIGAPRVDWDRSTMIVAQVADLAGDIAAGRRGLREPQSGSTLAAETFDLVIAPGLAFDESGARLGRGGGFYDRFLAELRCVSTASVLGVAFDEQIVPRVPMEGHDVAVDAIATPTRWLGPDAARFTG